MHAYSFQMHKKRHYRFLILRINGTRNAKSCRRTACLEGDHAGAFCFLPAIAVCSCMQIQCSRGTRARNLLPSTSWHGHLEMHGRSPTRCKTTSPPQPYCCPKHQYLPSLKHGKVTAVHKIEAITRPQGDPSPHSVPASAFTDRYAPQLSTPWRCRALQPLYLLLRFSWTAASALMSLTPFSLAPFSCSSARTLRLSVHRFTAGTCAVGTCFLLLFPSRLLMLNQNMPAHAHMCRFLVQHGAIENFSAEMHACASRKHNLHPQRAI